MKIKNTQVGVGYCNEPDAFSSGRIVAEKAMMTQGLRRPDLVVAFCSGQLDHNQFFAGLQSVVGKNIPIIGGSAIGVITNNDLSYKNTPAGAAIIESDIIQFRVASVGHLNKGEQSAGQQLIEELSSKSEDKMLFIFYDSVRIPATETKPPVLNTSSSLLAGIEKKLSTNVSVLGAGLMGDYAFGSTKQFCDSSVGSQYVTGLALSGNFQPYYRIMHGCTPLDGIYHRITHMEGSEIYELDDRPIVDIIDEIFKSRDWRKQHPVNNLTIGANFGEKYGEPRENYYVNRLITGILPDGGGINIFEADFETGMEIQFMLRDAELMIKSTQRNTAELLKKIGKDGKKAVFGMYIDCAGRTADNSNMVIEEASTVQDALNLYNIPLLGFYSGVEIAPLVKKSRGLDWTGVLVILAEDDKNVC
jgi:small ligand-binding sensory domain FIST